MQCPIFDRDDHGRLVRVTLRIDRDIAGDTREIFGVGNGVAQLLRISTAGSFDGIGQEVNGIIPRAAKASGSLLLYFFLYLSTNC